MSNEKDQHKVGIPAKPRGQQTGIGGRRDENRQKMEQTPALRGRLKSENKMFSDQSSQHIGGDSVTPSTNSPAIPAMNTGGHKGESGGEVVFKRRLAGKRKKNE